MRTPLLLFAALCCACGARSELAVGTAGSSSTTSAPWIVFDFDDGSTAPVPLEDSNSTIYAMHPNGSSLHAVNLDGARGIRPSVSPDGTKLLYIKVDGQHETLVLRDLVSHTEHTLASGTLSPDVLPYLSKGAVSPDNQLIAYGAWDDLRVVSADASGDHMLVAHALGDVGDPIFSPDSPTLYFAAGDYIESIHLDGSSAHALTQSGGSRFSLSPDGTRLAAVLFCGGADQLRIFPVPSLSVDSCAGTELAELGVDAQPGDSGPSWGPGDLIAYQDGWNILVVSANGGTPTNITSQLTTKGSVSHPVWAPGSSDL